MCDLCWDLVVWPGVVPRSTAALEGMWWPGLAIAVGWPWAAAWPRWAVVVLSMVRGW